MNKAGLNHEALYSSIVFFNSPDTEKQIQKVPKTPEFTCFQGFFMVKYR